MTGRYHYGGGGQCNPTHCSTACTSGAMLCEGNALDKIAQRYRRSFSSFER